MDKDVFMAQNYTKIIKQAQKTREKFAGLELKE